MPIARGSHDLSGERPCPRSLPALLSPVTRRLPLRRTRRAPQRQLEACLTSVQKGLLNNPSREP